MADLSHPNNPFGTNPDDHLARLLVDDVEIAREGDQLVLTPRRDDKRARAMWGLSRTLVNNLVHGVTQGYEQVLELVGIGYRAALKGQSLSMQLGPVRRWSRAGAPDRRDIANS